ncbi:MAG: SAM-dependent methyltransferase [Bryobacteraceae bacterium]|nr:SAM-dependent methyltransferase [Bryobacteraceae bacterium]
MSELTPLLRAEIERGGPISFERFMERALYHPEFGYYRRPRDPFGRSGDFFTAAQFPAFGILSREWIERRTPHRTSIDWGAGRAELRAAFEGWDYRAVEFGDPAPEPVDGAIVANELFDALPCRAYRDGIEALVDWSGERFVWTAEPNTEECSRIAPALDEFARVLRSGFALIFDYGYAEREYALRFPRGSLMSYRRHRAEEDVLDAPGTRDITAHVNFDALEREARLRGFTVAFRGPMRALLMQAGEEAVARAAAIDVGGLKTLLFGIGEEFLALALEKKRDP